MTGKPVSLEEVKTDRDLLAFIRLPWEIYKGDPYWAPPLIKDQLSRFSPAHPFRTHSKMVLFLARKEDRVVGRVAGIIDYHYVDFHREKVGFFGFFESIRDREVAESLLMKVRDWLIVNGMEKMAGPMNPSTNDECGLLVEGFNDSPCLMMPYNHPYYPSLLEGFGLSKVMDLYAYQLEEKTFGFDRLNRITERLRKKNPEIRLRSIDLRHLDRELVIVKEIYNEAWTKNWGFVPLTDEEIDDLAKNLKPLVVPELVIFAYWGEEPIGFSVSLPDYNKVLKHLNGKIGLLGGLKFLYYSRKIKTIRVMLLGVKKAFQKKGVEGILYMETFKAGIKKGYPQAECSWVLEDNLLMRHGIEAMGGKRTKTYRIYEASF